MASWKGHRGRHSQNQVPSIGRQTLNSQTDGLDRNEVPQRPPTVGQELPNNLIPSLQDWQLETRLKQPKNRKKGNLEKIKEKKPDVSTTSIGAHFGPPTALASHRHMREHSKSRMSDAESTSDGDANLQHSLAHGTRPKCDKIHKMESHTGDFNMERESVVLSSKVNSIKRLDTNQISGNLVQIREYIKQINTLVEPLEIIGDPADLEKLEKLRKVRFGLLENERTLVELLQRVSVLQNEQMRKDGSISDADSTVSAHGNALANVDGTSGISDASGDDADDGEDEASDSYDKRNELLQKVAESQLKLKALQGQQALLVALQQQAETRLAQARTFHDHLTSKTNENEQAELTADEYFASNVLQRDLLNIEQRLSLLQDMRSNKEREESPSRSVDGEARRPELDDRGCDVQRLELHNKLQDLQCKKKQMDDMLKELSTLRDVRMQEVVHINGHDINGPSDKKHTLVTKDSVAAAQQSLKSVELTDKRRKLEEMKSWLHNMEDIVYNYHSEQSANENPPAALQPSRGKLSEFPSLETPTAPVGNVQPKPKKGRKTKTDNLSRELSNECIAKLPSHSTLPHMEENRRRESFVEESDDHDLDLLEKSKKIHAAKTKLQKLQNLLTVVQQSQLSGEMMSAELAEQLLNSIDNDEGATTSNFGNTASSSEFHDHRLPLHQYDSGAQRIAKVNSKPAVVNRSEQQQQDRAWAEEMNAAREDRSRRKSNSTRESIGSASKLPTTNQELWLEMRHQMALQEELQQRRRELESLMQKDASKNYLLNQDNHSEHLSTSAKSEPLLVAASIGATDLTSAATWGGSSVDNGARENDSQEGQNERIDDEEYSSEEAVEQENPATVLMATNDSCLSKTKNRATPGSHGEAESSPFGIPDSHKASVGLGSADGAYPPQMHSAPTNNARVAWQQPERGHAQEHANTNVHDDHLGYDVASLPISLNLPVHANAPHQQMETATLLCQTILRDQHILSGLTQQSPQTGVPGTTVPLSPVHVPDMFQLHHSQMVQQQLLLSLSHCYHLLYLQHLEMQRLRQTVQTGVPNGIPYSDPSYPPPQTRNLINTCEGTDCQNHSVAPQWHLDNPSMARLSMSSVSSHPSHAVHHSHPPVTTDMPVHGTTTETLNNQVPPGNRANNYWDNFRSYSRQNLLSSTTHPNKSNDCPGGHCQGLPQRLSASAPIQNVKQHLHTGYSQFLQMHDEGQQGESSSGPTDGFSHVRGTENNARLSHVGSRGLLEAGSVLQNASKDKVNKDLGSLSSTPNVLKNRGNLSPNSSLPVVHSTPSRSLQTGTLSKAPLKTGWNKTNTITRERGMSNDKDAPFNPAQPVEESVYGEVSKLVSQFDSNPQYLIRLLKELRKLNSEKAARNALRALHDASMAFPGRNSADPVNTAACTKASHPAPGPSFGTTGGVRPRQPSREDSSSSEENEAVPHNIRSKKAGRPFQFVNPRTTYDVVNPSLGTFYNESTPESNNVVLTSYGEVGDSSCINSRHEKSVQCDRKPEDPSVQAMDWSLSNILSPANRQVNSASEGASSSARESEVSTSDVPCTRFNMLQLEKQMHGIMLSVASFIANFSQNNCSPELMAAISSHILVRVLPTLQNTNQETWSFIPGQITCVVDSILKKYQGKRIIDCEEALLAELSEVLFNELAFLQLMQNMDGNSAQAQSQKFHSIVQKFTCQPHEYKNGSDMCTGTTGEDTAAEMKLATNLLSAASLCTGAHAEATDADLMVMARRGDDEDNDKVHEDFSCDIPDACVGRGVAGGVPSSVACEEASFRASPLHNNAVHLDSHSLSPLPLPDLGALATAAEGQAEAHYFDREVELEGEGLGDTQDLAEADQSQGYMEAESALDDVQEEENFQAWGVDHALMNGGVDCTEDDQHNEDDPLGAIGGVPNFAAVELLEAQRSGPELGLDEVPIKLREGAGSRNATRDRGKDDGNKQDHPEHGDSKGRRSGGTDHGAKL